VFCGDHLRVRGCGPRTSTPAAGSLEEVQRIVRQIRARWPEDQHHLRADSGFCLWQEFAGVVPKTTMWNYVSVLRGTSAYGRSSAARKNQEVQTRSTGARENRRGCSASYAYRTKRAGRGRGAWSAKAEQIEGKENPATWSLRSAKKAWPRQNLYEQLYCARGEMENRIKEQLSLFADRMSTETLRAKSVAAILFLVGLCAG